MTQKEVNIVYGYGTSKINALQKIANNYDGYILASEERDSISEHRIKIVKTMIGFSFLFAILVTILTFICIDRHSSGATIFLVLFTVIIAVMRVFAYKSFKYANRLIHFRSWIINDSKFFIVYLLLPLIAAFFSIFVVNSELPFLIFVAGAINAILSIYTIKAFHELKGDISNDAHKHDSICRAFVEMGGMREYKRLSEEIKRT